MTRNRRPAPETEFDDEMDELDVAEDLPPRVEAAIVTGTDWTTETIVAQLERGNIQLNPRFQRRDAWSIDRKSRFVESLIVGLPIPQLVLAEDKRERGRFLVLDGKQRLLSIYQFWGKYQGDNNAYRLSALPLRKDLIGKSFEDLSTDPDLESEFASLCNQSIRTVVIRNWRDTNLLHTIFLRLNTGSVKLSPQELRQALLPGKFSDYIDEAAGSSPGLKFLLGIEGPDPRMRDIEILARFIAFRFFASEYPGRMKKFLDNCFKEFNDKWELHREKVVEAVKEFEKGVAALIAMFDRAIARKPDSTQFNRAIFDALIFYQSLSRVRKITVGKDARIVKAYNSLFDSESGFLKAVESDTAGSPNTAARLEIWAEALSKITGEEVKAPKIPTVAVSRKRPKPAHKKK
jgi:hypothetical protein